MAEKVSLFVGLVFFFSSRKSWGRVVPFLLSFLLCEVYSTIQETPHRCSIPLEAFLGPLNDGSLV